MGKRRGRAHDPVGETSPPPSEGGSGDHGTGRDSDQSQSRPEVPLHVAGAHSDARVSERDLAADEPAGCQRSGWRATSEDAPSDVAYEELGVNYYDERKKAAVVRNAVKRLEQLGYRVAIEPAA